MTIAAAPTGALRSEGVWRLVLAVLALWSLVLPSVLSRLSLPNDERYVALIGLMWAGMEELTPLAAIMYLGILAFAATIVAIEAACAVADIVVPSRVHGLGRRLTGRYVLAAPAMYLVSTSLGRLAANAIYAAGDWHLWSPSTLLAKLEGPLLIKLQEAFPDGMFSFLAATYCVGWLFALLAAAPMFMLMRHDRAVDAAILGPCVMVAIAIPIYVLFPTFDPWSFNPAYGASYEPGLAVKFMYPNSNPVFLHEVATSLRRVVGSGLPSLHVALPALFAIVSFKARLRAPAVFYAVVSLATSVAVVLLGRHWIADTFAGAVLALLAVKILDVTGLRVTLRGPTVGGNWRVGPATGVLDG